MCRTGEKKMEERILETELASGKRNRRALVERVPLQGAQCPSLSMLRWSPSAVVLRDPYTNSNWPQRLLQFFAGWILDPVTNQKEEELYVAPAPSLMTLWPELLKKRGNSLRSSIALLTLVHESQQVMLAFLSLPLLRSFSYFYFCNY